MPTQIRTIGKAGETPGQTSGAAVAAGYVGETSETIVGPTAATVSGAIYSIGSISVGPGKWRIESSYAFLIGTATSNTYFLFDINTSVAARNGNNVYSASNTTNGVLNVSGMCHPLIVNSSGTTTIYALGSYNFAAVGTSTARAVLTATRIA